MSRERDKISRVVPGIGVTIAASRRADYDIDQVNTRSSCILLPRKLSKLLLPALGGPNIANFIPERTISPRLESARWPWIVLIRDCTRSMAVIVLGFTCTSTIIYEPWSYTPSSISSPSPKSIRASTNARHLITSCLIWSISSFTFPLRQ
jgi:hypothetical protein